jgi:glutaredoxin
MLRFFQSFQPSMAIALAISSISMAGSVQASPQTTSHDRDTLQSSFPAETSNPPIRRYGSSHVALDTKIDTVSGSAELALAEHLAKSGAKFYGAQWCSHCQKQKSLFGATAASKLPYVECAKDAENSQRALCKQLKIQMFPTWIIDGKIMPGTRELKDIAAATGYTGPMNFKYHK